MSAGKLSDYQMKQIIAWYARGASPSDAARHMRVSYQTIRGIYDLIRKRMCESELYESMQSYYRSTDAWEERTGQYWEDGPFDRYLKTEMHRRGRIAPGTLELHQSELLYRFEGQRRSGAHFPRQHYAEIVAVIRLSGPLNRPLDSKGLGRVTVYRFSRFLTFSMGWLKKNPEAYEQLREKFGLKRRSPKG